MSDKILALLVSFVLGFGVAVFLYGKLLSVAIKNSARVRGSMLAHVKRIDAEARCGAQSDPWLQEGIDIGIRSYSKKSYCVVPIKYLDETGLPQLGRCPELVTRECADPTPDGDAPKTSMCEKHFAEDPLYSVRKWP